MGFSRTFFVPGKIFLKGQKTGKNLNMCLNVISPEQLADVDFVPFSIDLTALERLPKIPSPEHTSESLVIPFSPTA